ncbi:MAG: NUDIX domain-containing protein [Methylocystis sp.]|nr:NUDIX domain-containing protein [Methylocystis sp.]MBI3274362.1 NUDIX domain-containing protein [Methylocystis sp.]
MGKTSLHDETYESDARNAIVTRLITLGALVRRPMTLGVRGLVIDAANRVLLVRHTYVAGFYLPGGGVEGGETLAQALARELAEEANIVLEGPPTLHGVYLNRRASSRDHVALYIVREFRQNGPHVPDREIAEAGFFALDALPQDATTATRARLAEVLEGAPVSAYW